MANINTEIYGKRVRSVSIDSPDCDGCISVDEFYVTFDNDDIYDIYSRESVSFSREFFEEFLKVYEDMKNSIGKKVDKSDGVY